MKTSRTRAGFTVVEAMISIALIALVLTKLTIVVNEAQRAHRTESASMALEDQASSLIDKIAYAVVGSTLETLNPQLVAPFPMSAISYQISLGVENGKVVWGDPEVVGLNPDGDQIYWGQNVGQANERLVVWCNTVSRMLEDEFENGFDDNDNGLADELGLAFVMDGKSITIRLSLENNGKDGQSIQVTRETTVTCRN